MTQTAKREATLLSLTDLVKYFDPSNHVQMAHWKSLATEYGELAATMLVSQDVYRCYCNVQDDLELTDPGQVASWAGWVARNRSVKHGETARYEIFDGHADTKAGGRLIPMFTRDQTVPAYAQT